MTKIYTGRMAYVAAVLLSLALATAGCCSSTPAGCEQYTDEAGGFAIYYPQEWNVLPPEQVPQGLVAAIEAESACAGYTPNLNVVKEELSEPSTLAQWFERHRMMLSLLPGYALVSKQDIAVSGAAAVKHVFTYEHNNVPVEVMQVYLIKGNTAWGVTCRCAVECWDQYEKTFDAVVRSLRLL